MKNNELLKGNFLVCMIIIIIGFAITSAISYQSTIGIYKTDTEQVSTLTSDGIYSNISMIFAKPLSISLTMANDNLLRTFLKLNRQQISWRNEGIFKRLPRAI
ncbi:MAG: hypothetical protein RSC64_03250 [Hydrogenoanaerobacterium sp.]